MSVRKRSWKTRAGEVKTAWIADVADANGNRPRKQFKSRQEAKAYEHDIEGKKKSGTLRADGAKVAVREAAVDFLDYCRDRMERGERMTRKNVAVIEGHLWNYICPDPKRHQGKKRPKRLKKFSDGIGDLTFDKVTSRTVKTLRDDLRTAGVSVVTTRKILGTLSQMMTFCMGEDLIAINPVHGIKVIGKRSEGSKKIVPPTKEAMRALLAVAEQDFRIKLAFASVTGVRAGELHALRWRHLNFTKAEVEVESRVDTYGDEDVTKTAAGMRTIPLSQSLILMLKEWKVRAQFKKPDDLVFPSESGTYTGHDNMVKRKFNPLFDKLAELHAINPKEHPEAPVRFTWHGLRHFAISCWIEADLKPKTVQTFAGHSSLQVTMDRYGHLFKSEDHKRAMDAIGADILKSSASS